MVLDTATPPPTDFHASMIEVVDVLYHQSGQMPWGTEGWQQGRGYLTVSDPKKIKKVKKGLSIGSNVAYTVKRDDGKHVLEATLAEVPEQVMARWIGEHMLDQHAHIEVASR